MKVLLQKTLRVSAIAAALLATSQCGWAIDGLENADSVANFLKARILSQAYASGPWDTYPNVYDYNYGGGEFEGTADKLTFKNFYFPGLDVDATITQESGNYYLNIDISKDYTLRQVYNGYPAGYTASIYTAYVDPSSEWDIYENNYFGTKEFNGKQYGWIRANDLRDRTKPYSLKLSDDYNGGLATEDLRYNNGSNDKGLIIVIKDTAGNIVDAKTFIGGKINSRHKATATAKDYDKEGNLMRTYPVYYYEEGTAYYLYNLNCRGIYYTTGGYTDSPIEITVNAAQWDNQLYIRQCNIGLINNSTNFKFEGYGKLSELLSDETLATDDEYNAYWFSYDAANRSELKAYSDAENIFKTTNLPAAEHETFGYFEADNEIDHNHPETVCPWVTNDGDRLTGGGKDIVFKDYGLRISSNSNSDVALEPSYYEEYSETRIVWGGFHDFTLGVDLSIEEFGANSGCVYVKGKITPTKNVKFVDHYELCIKKGHETSVNEFPSEGDNDYRKAANGYPKATNLFGIGNIESANENTISVPLTVKRRAAASSSSAEVSDDPTDEIEFTKFFSTSELNEKASASNLTDYSFYVKAVYKDEYVGTTEEDPGLNPTYHSLTTFSGTLTGVESVADSSSDVAIYGVDGAIEVFGEVSSVGVYTISGAQVYSGSEKTIAVPAGLYIVKAGKAVAKVVVK
jgi:hypothetical protein